jgi:hypothetical protein
VNIHGFSIVIALRCASAVAGSGGQADDQTLRGDELIAVSK